MIIFFIKMPETSNMIWGMGLEKILESANFFTLKCGQPILMPICRCSCYTFIKQGQQAKTFISAQPIHNIRNYIIIIISSSSETSQVYQVWATAPRTTTARAASMQCTQETTTLCWWLLVLTRQDFYRLWIVHFICFVLYASFQKLILVTMSPQGRRRNFANFMMSCEIQNIFCLIFMRESSYCFQRILAIAVLSIHTVSCLEDSSFRNCKAFP